MAPGVVREVVYAGATTRVVVALDAGGELVALLAADGGDVSLDRGDRVDLAWRPADAYRLPDHDTRPEPEPVPAP